MWRIGIGLVAGAIIIANGYLHGLRINRWERPLELDAAVANIDRVPMKIGQWEAKSEKLEDAAIANAGIDRYFLRRYENRYTGKTISVLLMCGRPGPLSVHTPDICYGNSGYAVDGAIAKESEKYGNDSAAAEVWSAKFSKPDVTSPTNLRIKWSWAADGKWLAPDNPRIDFARYAVLYKLYVIQEVAASSERAHAEVFSDFLNQLLPALDPVLFAAN